MHNFVIAALLVAAGALLGIGCYPTKESFSACCSTCQDLAAICTQAAAVYVETDRPLAIAASKECLGAYAECREACKP
ncbi:MAG: hypothetical protein JXB32_24880 [Deltaproteobacteria bacterium]|nr:hypothetical protein [Deltaproteobacteria bacterium]